MTLRCLEKLGCMYQGNNLVTKKIGKEKNATNPILNACIKVAHRTSMIQAGAQAVAFVRCSPASDQTHSASLVGTVV